MKLFKAFVALFLLTICLSFFPPTVDAVEGTILADIESWMEKFNALPLNLKDWVIDQIWGIIIDSCGELCAGGISLEEWEEKVLPTLSYRDIATLIWGKSVANNLYYCQETIDVINIAIEAILKKQNAVGWIWDRLVVDRLIIFDILKAMMTYKALPVGPAAINSVAASWRSPVEIASQIDCTGPEVVIPYNPPQAGWSPMGPSGTGTGSGGDGDGSGTGTGTGNGGDGDGSGTGTGDDGTGTGDNGSGGGSGTDDGGDDLADGVLGGPSTASALAPIIAMASAAMVAIIF